MRDEEVLAGMDNPAVAGGTLGTDLVAKAPAASHTLAVLTLSSAVLTHFLYKRLPYDTRRDFAAVSEIGRSPNVVAIRPGHPARDLAGLIATDRREQEAAAVAAGRSFTCICRIGDQVKPLQQLSHCLAHSGVAGVSRLHLGHFHRQVTGAVSVGAALQPSNALRVELQ